MARTRDNTRLDFAGAPSSLDFIFSSVVSCHGTPLLAALQRPPLCSAPYAQASVQRAGMGGQIRGDDGEDEGEDEGGTEMGVAEFWAAVAAMSADWESLVDDFCIRTLMGDTDGEGEGEGEGEGVGVVVEVGVGEGEGFTMHDTEENWNSRERERNCALLPGDVDTVHASVTAIEGGGATGREPAAPIMAEQQRQQQEQQQEVQQHQRQQQQQQYEEQQSDVQQYEEQRVQGECVFSCRFEALSPFFRFELSSDALRVATEQNAGGASTVSEVSLTWRDEDSPQRTCLRTHCILRRLKMEVSFTWAMGTCSRTHCIAPCSSLMGLACVNAIGQWDAPDQGLM